MRIALGLATVVALLAPSPPAHADDMTPARRAESCRYQSANPRVSWSTWEVRRSITCAAIKRGVSKAVMLAIAYRESRFDAGARNSEGACGLFQFMPGWHPHLASLGALNGVAAAPACTNGRTSALAAARVIAGPLGTDPWS